MLYFLASTIPYTRNYYEGQLAVSFVVEATINSYIGAQVQTLL